MPTQERLHELYDYDAIKGALTHKRTRGHARKGVAIGSPYYKGYVICRIYNYSVKLHRLMWVYHHGPIPKGMQIDHINGIRNDNHIENLRLATNAQNSRNRCISRNNTSGASGVQWRKDRKRWIVRIPINGVRKILGSFKNIEDAKASRKEAERRLGYFPEHGKRKATPRGMALKVAA